LYICTTAKVKTLTILLFCTWRYQSRRIYFFIMKHIPKTNFFESVENPYFKNNYDSNGVTKPEQYQIGIDTFQRAESNLSKEEILAICKFNIDKYCWRKKDQDKEDFKKIIDYANWAIKNL